MDGKTMDCIVIPIVVITAQAVWLIVVTWAEHCPLRAHRHESGRVRGPVAAAQQICRVLQLFRRRRRVSRGSGTRTLVLSQAKDDNSGKFWGAGQETLPRAKHRPPASSHGLGFGRCPLGGRSGDRKTGTFI